MKRREVITVLGGSLVGLSGCTNDGASPRGATGSATRTGTSASPTTARPSATPTEGSTPTPSPTEIPTEGIEVRFEVVQPTVVTFQTDDLRVMHDEEQYLYVRVEGTGDASLEPQQFRFRFAGGEYEPLHSRFAYRRRFDSPYNRSRGYGYLLYQLPPTGSGEEARLVVGDAEWKPPARIRRLLEVEPTTFAVDPSFPETVAVGETPTIPLTVENEHDRPGWFVASLDRSGPSVANIPVARIRESVAAGETTEVTVTDEVRMGDIRNEELGDGKPDIHYTLEWESDRIPGSVRMVE